MRLRTLSGPAISTVLPFIVFELLQMQASIDYTLQMPRGHFYIVSAVSLLATLIAIAIGIAGMRVRNIQINFLSLAFISLAEIFAVHGLATPNFLIAATHLPAVSAQLSIILATCWLYLSTLHSDHPLIVFFSRQGRRLLPIWIAVLSVLGVAGLLFPHVVDFIRLDVHPLNGVMAALTVVLNMIVMYRYSESFRFSRFPLQISIVYSSGWLITSQLIMTLGSYWHLSWWIYHFLLLGSMIIVLTGLIKQYVSSSSLTSALRALFTTDPMERMTSCLSPSIKKLVLATETKDTYTAGHNLRVALYALRLAEELHVTPEQLRALAQGTIVHDVGKLHIPDSILNKPGKLTAEERRVIETHPVKGYELCRSFGFMKEELEIIRFHHEKWDGTGYPDRLHGENIPMLARIVAVADVYDALTSNRAYRKALSHHQAMELLEERKGTHFDPQCMTAWKNVCERDPSVYQYPLQKIREQDKVSLLTAAEDKRNDL